MVGVHPVRDPAIIDFLEAHPRRPFQGTLWRAVRADRDPLRSSSPKGRWDDGSIDVLYASLQANGADLAAGDGIAASDEPQLALNPQSASEVMLFDLG